MPERTMQLLPDWVLVGVREGLTFAVYGSTELTKAELSYVASDLRGLARALDARRIVGPPSGYRLTAGLKRYAVGFGLSYREAMANLMEMWDPDEVTPTMPSLGPETRVLGPSSSHDAR